MDSFERAHVPRKTDLLKNKTKTVKAQYKQMLHAFKKGDNEGILSSSDIKPDCIFDESFNSSYTISDYPELNSPAETEEAENDLNSTAETEETENVPNSVPESWDDIDEDVSLVCLPSGPSSVDTKSPSNCLSNLSTELEESDSSDCKLDSKSSSEESIENDSDSEEFDAEGILASKIKEKLNKNLVNISEDEILQDDKLNHELNKNEAYIKKIGKQKEKDKDYFLSEEYCGDNGSWKEVIIGLNESKKEACSKKSKKSNKKKDSLEFSDGNTIQILRKSEKNPPAFVSVCAPEIQSINTQLNELVGQYVHPTIKNIYSEELYLASNTSPSDIFPTNMCDKDLDNVTMTLDAGSDEEMNSLLPEVDEDLTLDDLNIEEDSRELTENSQQTIVSNDTVSTETSHVLLSDEIPTAAEYVQMKLYNGNDNFILVMRHPSEIFIHGKVKISDLNSSSEILGYKLTPDPVKVFTPYSHYAQCLKTNNSHHHPITSDLCRLLTAEGLTAEEATEIFNHYCDEDTAVVLLSKLNSPALDFVGSNFSAADLFSRRGVHIPPFLRKAAEALGCSLYLTPPKKRFEERKIWEEVYSSIICRKEKSRGIICGGKNMGKSTFLRHYVNTMLADGPILVLDLDPGQAEFSIPGNVSATVVEKPLIGPSFTHLRTPNLMLNIGIINTMDNAKRYLSAVSELIAHCRTNLALRELPWIINTMGLCNNMGLKFMTYIILLVQPTFLFQIDSRVPKKSFGFELDPITVTQLYEKNASNFLFEEIQNPYCLHYSFIISRPDSTAQVGNGSSTNLLPRDERYLNILAYFGELFQQYEVDSLLDIIPFEVNIKDLNFGLNVKIPENTLAQVVNGKIVALCQQKDRDKLRLFTLGDNALECYGHGLIRNIDYGKGILYILTPVPIRSLCSVDTLVYSDWMPELRGLEKSPLPNGTTIPYRTSSTEFHQRKFMFAPRRRFNPLQLVKLSRNT